MSKHLSMYEVDARVYYFDQKTQGVTAKGVAIRLQAYNKRNAKKRAERHVTKLQDVQKVEVLGARRLDNDIKH